jgi:hypothetical protein
MRARPELDHFQLRCGSLLTAQEITYIVITHAHFTPLGVPDIVCVAAVQRSERRRTDCVRHIRGFHNSELTYESRFYGEFYNFEFEQTTSESVWAEPWGAYSVAIYQIRPCGIDHGCL